MFVSDYISYYKSPSIYTAAIDYNNDGQINFQDLTKFVCYYIGWYSSWGPAEASQTQTPSLLKHSGADLANGQYGADNDPTLSLNASPVLPSIGDSFNVTLSVDNVTNLWAWGNRLTWDPNVLNLTDINEGPFLSSGGLTLFLNSLGDPSAPNGTLQDMGDVLESSSCVNGSGDLAILTFQVLSTAPTTISLTGGELDSPDLGGGIQVIPCTINNLTVNQDISVTNFTSLVSYVQTGFELPVNTTIQNTSSANQTVTVQIYLNGTMVDAEHFTVAANSFSTVTSMCNTTGFAVGNDTISVYAYPVGNGVCEFGSSFVGGIVLVTYEADINGDGLVNFGDMVAFNSAYVKYNVFGIYNPCADFNHDGVINSVDQVLFDAAYNADYSYDKRFSISFLINKLIVNGLGFDPVSTAKGTLLSSLASVFKEK